MWKEYAKEKPDRDMICLVANIRAGSEIFQTCYRVKNDLFWYQLFSRNESHCLDVTHWMEIPRFPLNWIEDRWVKAEDCQE
jgi:hypothetical protein